MKLPHPAASLALIAFVTLVPRLAALPRAGEDRLTPDGARFLNLARSIERGSGYATPEAWPAWLNPASLPAPETFKEPGYPYAIAALTPIAGDSFRAGQWLSLLAGVLLPFVVWMLMRSLDSNANVALMTALLAAASPVLIRQSVYVMAESPFVLLLTLSFALAAWRPGGARAAWTAAAGAGAALGLAYLVRAQAALALPATLGLLALGRPPRMAVPRWLLAAGAAALVALPWWLRNARLFGDPLHTDVAAFALWPYVDTFAFAHGLDRPGPVLGFALQHPLEILQRSLTSLRRFAWHTLPHDLLGSRIWLVPFAAGAIVALGGTRAKRGSWRTWWPLLGFAALSAAFLLPLHWVARYFAAVAPVACALTALGAAWLGRGESGRALAGPVRTGHAIAAGFAILLVLGSVDGVRGAGDTFRPELDAARALGPALGGSIAPTEAVMAELTSYWAWYADRPVVHPVVADDSTLRAIARRHRVRRAVFTPHLEREYAARLPGAQLPTWFVPIAVDTALGVRLYELRP